MHLPTPLYRRMVSNSIPGPNKSAAKARSMRQFLIPLEFNEPVSPDADVQRYIRIFVALVTEETTFVISDFSRLVKFNFVSKKDGWTHEDFNVGSWVSIKSLCMI